MPFELSIVTPSGRSFEGSAESVVLPGSEGDFGVLPGHERFLTPLRVGEVEIRAGGETRYAAIASGFADVRGDAVAVLVESCELASDIDAARARMAAERAEQDLARLGVDESAERRAEFEAALARARNRLAISAQRAAGG